MTAKAEYTTTRCYYSIVFYPILFCVATCVHGDAIHALGIRMIQPQQEVAAASVKYLILIPETLACCNQTHT